MGKVSIIIPIYNEEKTLPYILERVEKSDTLGLEKEIILVDDGSTDGTGGALKSLESKYKIIRHQVNQGKGRALINGFAASTGDIILIQDADLEYNPSNYPQLLEPILQNRTDVVYGSRNLKKNPADNLKFYLGRRLTNLFLNMVYNSRLTDFWTCYKVFRAKVIKNLALESNRFDIEVEMTAKLIRAGYKILEVPIDYFPRDAKAGKKIKPKDGLIAIWKILKYRF
jgi:glycosyltransferase involved in cell wall biosynthesis